MFFEVWEKVTENVCRALCREIWNALTFKTKKNWTFDSCEPEKEFQLSPLAKSKNATSLTASKKSRYIIEKV